MINVEKIKKFKTENKTVLIRFDLNVPLASGSTDSHLPKRTSNCLNSVV